MISSLRIQNFRKHRDFKFDFTNQKTLFIGKNGSGKTSIIEAIYIALAGKSWRSNFYEITRRSAKWWRIDLEFDNGKKCTVKYQNQLKSFEIDNKIFTRLPLKYHQPVILFEPGDLNLLYGSPARRRSFIDQFITQIQPGYHTILKRYERVLKQRSTLLKSGASRDKLFIWDIQLSDLAAEIITSRRQYIRKINQQITDEYQKIAGTTDKVKLTYQFYYDDKAKTRQTILDELFKNHRKELLLGYTSLGPHQHDISFLLNNKPAADTASRGENRTIILALKNIEYRLVANRQPIVLFDDILSEFDDQHQQNLIKGFGSEQLVITAVKSPPRVKAEVVNL